VDYGCGGLCGVLRERERERERERDGVEMLALVEDVFGSTPLKAVDMGTEKALAGFSRF